MTYHGIDIPSERIAEFCLRHRIRRLSLFGSILRDDFRPESDIDVLVDFEPGATPGIVAPGSVAPGRVGIAAPGRTGILPANCLNLDPIVPLRVAHARRAQHLHALIPLLNEWTEQA